MSYIPTLLASLDARLDELATEISTLQDGRAALRTPTPATPPTAISGPVNRNRLNAAIASTRCSLVRCGIRCGAEERSGSPASPSTR